MSQQPLGGIRRCNDFQCTPSPLISHNSQTRTDIASSGCRLSAGCYRFNCCREWAGSGKKIGADLSSLAAPEVYATQVMIIVRRTNHA